MKTKFLHIVWLIVCVFILSGCNKNDGFTNTELGFSFKRCTKHDSAPKAQKGDVLFGQMKILLNNKTEIFSNYGSPERLFVITDPKIGSIDEFLSTLHLGDSAVMIAPADSLMKYTQNIETRPKDKVYIYLSVMQIISADELSGYEKEQQIKRQKEDEILTEYVLANYERAEKKESGLFYLLVKEGQGKKVEFGKRVHVFYAVTDTTGKLYDTNIKEIAQKHLANTDNLIFKSFDFTLGDDALIAGWSEGVSYMREGGKAKLIIPSYLAYGENGFGRIPPSTPLIFDISVAKVEDIE
ncbi:MAG: FKBP-type peptidyl-prolyl cis-trans isomerase [Bacteroidales bacterium]|nr:FKBP-type peptidyl-prolyl cis-trans isomerase [Bacteroidales bacterium]